MKLKKGRWVLWNIKQRMLSHMKLKIEDVESYEHANKYWYTEAQTCKKARGWLSKRVIHLKLKRKNTRSRKPAYRKKTMTHLKHDMNHMSFGTHYDEWKKACKLLSECRLCTHQCNAKGFESWKLRNAYDILSFLLYFVGLFCFFEKHRLTIYS